MNTLSQESTLLEPLPFDTPAGMFLFHGFADSNVSNQEDDEAAFDDLVDQVLGGDEEQENSNSQVLFGNNDNTLLKQVLPAAAPVSSPLIDNLCMAGVAAPNATQSFWQTAVSNVVPNTVVSQQQQVDQQQQQVSEKPKRSLSAYNLFFQAERKKLLQSLPDRPSQGKGRKPRNSHGKLGFAEMARLVSAKWKKITPEEKAPFDELAKRDTLRYKREMQEWKSQNEQPKNVFSTFGMNMNQLNTMSTMQAPGMVSNNNIWNNNNASFFNTHFQQMQQQYL
eukprot:CAMPEP_0172446344 /NCGR_PEP_ID=MMETSP1065-20121228/5958_1 /TAXON_ID=265537 /ORGANISM="Amphiprora paludosa, Strain CCMP125" /LENGTH=279 /DNA_ID=CAMNT_0013197435 /DNA_START=112 /DNA_END=951 /DNA_ORIENTATION=+